MKKILAGFTLFFTSIIYAQQGLEGINGEMYPFSSLRGNWVFINYWATWCEPCLEEIPVFNDFYHKYKNSNVKVFGVNFDGIHKDEQTRIIKRLNIDYPSLKTSTTQNLHIREINSIPTTFVFNPEGKLVKKLYGAQTSKNLIKAMH